MVDRLEDINRNKLPGFREYFSHNQWRFKEIYGEEFSDASAARAFAESKEMLNNIDRLEVFIVDPNEEVEY